MICEKCNLEVNDEQKFCSGCGVEFKWGDIASEQPWYHSTGWLIFWCVVFWPVGFYGLFKRGVLPHAVGALILVSILTSIFGTTDAVNQSTITDVTSSPSNHLVIPPKDIKEHSTTEVIYSGDLNDLTRFNYSLLDMHDGSHTHNLKFSNGWLTLTGIEYDSTESGRLISFSSPNSSCIGFEKEDSMGKLMSKRVENPIKQQLLCVAEAEFNVTGYGVDGGEYKVTFTKGDVFFKSYANAFIQSPSFFKLVKKG